MKQVWPQVRLFDLMSQVQRDEAPASGKNYRQIGVRLWGQGAYERESIDGSQTQYAKLFEAREGDIVVNKIWARNGSVAVVSDALNGSWGSTEFPLFEPDRTRLNPRWMHWITKAPWFWHACDEHAKGTSGKNRIKPDQFLGIEIPLPPFEVQQSLVDRIDTVQQKIQAAEKLRASIDKDIASLLAVRFQETMKQAPLLPMREVAPLVRRNVQLEAKQQYKELGARSFGKGLFVKPDFDADSATWEKPVWIKAGDIVFSNIKAWEGAIGVAKPEHDGFIASHRYLTAVVKTDLALPEYLLYYLLSETGLTAVNEASPGTADRNRTTKQSALEAIQVPVPPVAIQRQFVKLKQALEQAAEVRTKQMVNVEAMLPALCNQVLSQQ
jgi:type I restriction enzyme S subunit